MLRNLSPLLLLILLTPHLSSAAVQIPKKLSESDRQEVTRLLGWGTASKILSDPYPLGGYSGVEVGLGVESVPIDELSRLGSPTAPQDRFTYPEITIGKGFYNSVDAFVNFIPFTESIGFSEYGGLLRWGFYQATFIPASFSVLIYGNSSNIQNQVLTQSFGVDLVAGINMDDLSIYFGGGKIRSSSQFIGVNDTNINGANNVESVTAEGFHSFLGLAFHVQPFFVAIQIDKYAEAVASAKLGVRF